MWLSSGIRIERSSIEWWIFKLLGDFCQFFVESGFWLGEFCGYPFIRPAGSGNTSFHLHRAKTSAHRLKSVDELKKNQVLSEQSKFEPSNIKWMDTLLKKKINLLIHLAHVDGTFAEAEQALMKSVLEENGLGEQYLLVHERSNVAPDELVKMDGKEELLYWCLLLIHADGNLHPAEVAYSKFISDKLGFQAKAIDHFTGSLPATFNEFKKQLVLFRKK